ncbi:MAG: ankyrin repeat domain-containing protein, partial [candidate division Zixibacteria bacterium]|nr:ankyrin repeat domain-containing protein [candidate division Zixibacteria bacterium]
MRRLIPIVSLLVGLLLLIASNSLHAQSVCEAIKKCDLTDLKSHLSNRSDIDSLQFDSNEKTALMVAAEAGCISIVIYLLENNSDVDKVSEFGETALKFAVRENHKDIVELLINHGANIDNSEDEYGSSLISAAFNGNHELTRILIKAGADVNREGFLPPIEINNCMFSGGTPLMFAAVN